MARICSSSAFKSPAFCRPARFPSNVLLILPALEWRGGDWSESAELARFRGGDASESDAAALACRRGGDASESELFPPPPFLARFLGGDASESDLGWLLRLGGEASIKKQVNPSELRNQNEQKELKM